MIEPESMASLLVCIKELESFGFGFFVGDVMSGVGLRIFGWDYLALGLNHKRQFFDSSFYWKLGYNVSCLSPWLAF